MNADDLEAVTLRGGPSDGERRDVRRSILAIYVVVQNDRPVISSNLEPEIQVSWAVYFRDKDDRAIFNYEEK